MTTMTGRPWSRLLEMEFVDRAVVLAAKALVALLPLPVIVAALSPDGFCHHLLDVRAYLRARRGPPVEGVRNKGRGALWLAGVLTC
jgi:hypothetical protein